jgi:uncharacterized protein
LPEPTTTSPCQACGACCAYSRWWPRFTVEDDDEIALIPPYLIDDTAGGMRCDGDRCLALDGEVGVATGCAIYEDRPAVCRACQPGDEECLTARRRHGLPPLAIPAAA